MKREELVDVIAFNILPEKQQNKCLKVFIGGRCLFMKDILRESVNLIYGWSKDKVKKLVKQHQKDSDEKFFKTVTALAFLRLKETK